ncbi:MAG: site-specific integrase, partial [Atopobiaceae bacterium]|nr:site-specific integrase [Atopobiaceae bacterium]
MSDAEATIAAREFVAHCTDALESGARGLQAQLYLYLDNAEATRSLQASTLRKYRSYARRYVAPVADLPLSEVSASTIDTLTRGLIQDGPRGGKPLARSTVRCFQQFLQGAFNYFVAMELIARNPVKDSMRIRIDTPEAEPLDETAFQAVKGWLEREIAADPTDETGRTRRNAALCMQLALKTGMRVGELCALRRKDVRTLQRTISVNGTMPDNSRTRQNDTKGHRVRNIGITEADCKAILAHERWQMEYLPTADASTPIFT